MNRQSVLFFQESIGLGNIGIERLKVPYLSVGVVRLADLLVQLLFDLFKGFQLFAVIGQKQVDGDEPREQFIGFLLEGLLYPFAVVQLIHVVDADV